MKKIKPSKVMYIKLGRNGMREAQCLSDGLLYMMYLEAPHKDMIAGNFEVAKHTYESLGKTSRVGTTFMNDLKAFYEDTDETLWITFMNGSLYWCFAKPDVSMVDGDGRYRVAIDGWKNETLDGRELDMHVLHGSLTKTAAYRGTVCPIADDVAEYLTRLINGEPDKELVKAKKLQKEMYETTKNLMQRLQPNDFELFVDLLFARSGWQRKSIVGGSQKTVDFEMTHPFDNKKAFVQVKSKTTQAQFDEYVERFLARDDDAMFYVHHKCASELMNDHENVHLMGADALAKTCLRVGLFDWLLEKASYGF